MKTKKLFWLPIALLMAACSNESEEGITAVSSTPIQFRADILPTRVTGDLWDVNDRIGIFMSEASTVTKSNVPYIAGSSDGKFSPEGEGLYFPDGASDVDFYAYYPYSSELSDNNVLTFNVDGKTDVLWVKKTVTAAEQANINVSLPFSHALSKVLVQTTGFAEDVKVSLEGKGYSQGQLNVMDGTVSGSGETADITIPLSATSNSGEFSGIILPDAAGEEKVLIVESESENRQWEYTISTLTLAGGTQYIFKVNSSNAGIVVVNSIIPWTSGGTTNLTESTESSILPTIEEYLAGKTFKPDLNYFYDELDEEYNGHTYKDLGGFGTNYNEYYWREELYNQCNNSSITFYYGADEKLMAKGVNDVTSFSDIEVTVDEENKTLKFSQEPFNYHWSFTDKVNYCGEDYWSLFAEKEEHTSFTPNTEAAIKDLFTNDKMHWAFWSTKDNKYYVVNFVMVDGEE